MGSSYFDLALAINPKLKVEVYEWLFDKLLNIVMIAVIHLKK